MSKGKPRAYAPMTSRHKRVFAFAALGGVVVVAGIAMARLELIKWWINNCGADVPGCGAAEIAFDWWWVLLLCAAASIAFTAHWVTRDRLRPPA